MRWVYKYNENGEMFILNHTYYVKTGLNPISVYEKDLKDCYYFNLKNNKNKI